jgi:hypothetical protein
VCDEGVVHDQGSHGRERTQRTSGAGLGTTGV